MFYTVLKVCLMDSFSWVLSTET